MKSKKFSDIALLKSNSEDSWFIWETTTFIVRSLIDKFAICEPPSDLTNEIKDQIINFKGNIFIDSNKNEILRLKKRSLYKIEVNCQVFHAWICNLISIDKINKITGNVISCNDTKLPLDTSDKIYARCPKSMRIFDKINRNFVQTTDYAQNKIMAIKAVAGSGKTTTLLNLAKRDTTKKILYLAFNRSLIDEIKNKLFNQKIQNLIPKTFDALMREIYIHANQEEPALTDLTPQYLTSKFLWFNGKAFKLKKHYCKQFANFCSDIRFDNMDDYCKTVLKNKNTFLQDLWKLTLSNQFQTFDSIRKLAVLNHWAKEYIDKKYDMIFIDEAQDFDKVMLNILIEDTTIPKIFVGDPLQAIYEWRGCINAFDYLPESTQIVEFYTTFRVGEPACSEIARKFKNCWMISKNTDETLLTTADSEDFRNGKYVYLFRSWKGLLLKAKELDNIWIYGFNKQIVQIRKLHGIMQFAKLSEDEKGEFSDDLPLFLMQLTSNDLDDLLTKIQEHLVDEEDCNCKMYTIHSYKGMENDIVRIHNDIDTMNEKNLYYVALTRGMRKIVVDKDNSSGIVGNGGLEKMMNLEVKMDEATEEVKYDDPKKKDYDY